MLLPSSVQWRVLAACAMALCSAGCAALLGGKSHTPIAVYLLQVDGVNAPLRAGPCGTLEVTEPEPAPGYATARMLYQREPHRIQPYAYARWAEPPAAMVKAALVAALEHSGLFAAVLPAPATVAPQLRLESDALMVLQQFDAAGSEAQIALSVRLVDLHRAQLLAVRRLAVTLPAGADAASGVDAANRALAQLVGELVGMAREAMHCEAS